MLTLSEFMQYAGPELVDLMRQRGTDWQLEETMKGVFNVQPEVPNEQRNLWTEKRWYRGVLHCILAVAFALWYVSDVYLYRSRAAEHFEMINPQVAQNLTVISDGCDIFLPGGCTLIPILTPTLILHANIL